MRDRGHESFAFKFSQSFPDRGAGYTGKLAELTFDQTTSGSEATDCDCIAQTSDDLLSPPRQRSNTKCGVHGFIHRAKGLDNLAIADLLTFPSGCMTILHCLPSPPNSVKAYQQHKYWQSREEPQ